MGIPLETGWEGARTRELDSAIAPDLIQTSHPVTITGLQVGDQKGLCGAPRSCQGHSRSGGAQALGEQTSDAPSVPPCGTGWAGPPKDQAAHQNFLRAPAPELPAQKRVRTPCASALLPRNSQQPPARRPYYPLCWEVSSSGACAQPGTQAWSTPAAPVG